MENYSVGNEVTISNQALYEKYGRYLRWCRIDKTTEDNGEDYYDIYKSWGNHLGMDGETCTIEEIGGDYVLLLNENGEIDTHVKLTKEEFACGCIIHKQIKE